MNIYDTYRVRMKKHKQFSNKRNSYFKPKKKNTLVFKLKLILIGIAIIAIFFFSQQVHKDYKTKKVETITIADAARLMSFTTHTKEEWEQLFIGEEKAEDAEKAEDDEMIEDAEKAEDAEMIKDAEKADNAENNENSESSEKKENDGLTYEDINTIYDQLQDPTERYIENVTENVEIKEWFTIYNNLVEKYDSGGTVKFQEAMVLGTYETMQGLTTDQVYTNQGAYKFDSSQDAALKKGLLSDMNLICINDVIVYVKEYLHNTVLLSNVWFLESNDNGFSVFVDGFTIPFQDSSMKEPFTNEIGDIKMKDGKVISITKKQEKISGKILAIRENGIEIEGYGLIPKSEYFHIYKIYGQPEMLSESSLTIGYNFTEFVVANGELCAALVNQSPSMTNIRVLIKTNDFASEYHDSITLTSNCNYKVTSNGVVTEFSAGQEVNIDKNSSLFSDNRIKIEPATLSGDIIVKSLKRACGNPTYKGCIEISREEKGLLMVNELLLEEYLYAVLPSEMPDSYGLEALKAQAVCARSYAYNQILNNGCAEFGAHVDDSTKYQVYHNYEESQLSIEAVKETSGLVATYNNSVITAYYFSTSCGHTTNYEVWGENNAAQGYLAGVYSNATQFEADLSDESLFRDFILNYDFPSFEKDICWYRWETSLQASDIEKNIKNVLASRYKADNTHVLTKNEAGEFVSQPIESIGDIKNISVGHRNNGGLVDQLIIEGTKKTVKVLTEYNVRSVLAPANSEIIRKDNTTVDGSSLLPSAYILLEPEYQNNVLKSLKIIGGGFGHGAGMSQNGAKEMAAAGYTYEDILKFYYTGISLTKLY